MNKALILAGLLLAGQTSWAQIRQFNTTRLMSTGSTGVASILSTEAAVLNPATAAFFKESSFSYQSYNTKLTNIAETRDEEFPQQNKSQGIFLADHGGPVKGGTGYIVQDENGFQRKRAVLHGASPMGKSSAMGVSYSFIEDKRPVRFKKRKQTHHQASIGFIHIIDERTILGVVVLDPTRTTPNEERAIAGFQYSLADRFTLIGDIGAQYTKDVSKKYLWSAAVQMNLFSDFFLRAGRFYDNISSFKGTGWGVSWIGPRLGIEFAQRYSEQFRSGYIYQDEKLIDTSISALIKF